MQLVISADNRSELRYAEVDSAGGQVPVRWKNSVNISRGLGVQFDKTKNGHSPAFKRRVLAICRSAVCPSPHLIPCSAR